MSGPSIRIAAKIVKGGGVIVYPTDTVYGLGCDPRRSSAVERLCRIKGRELKPLPVLCDSFQSAARLVSFNDRSEALARSFWPGALTIVLPLKMELPEAVHAGSGTLGVRVPDSAGCVRLIAACGGLLVGTSANKSGRPSSRLAQEAFESLGDMVDLVLDGGPLQGRESTVVRVEGNHMDILREGELHLPEKS